MVKKVIKRVGPPDKNSLPLSTIVLTGKKEGGSTKKMPSRLVSQYYLVTRRVGPPEKIDDHLVPQY